jgi:hypothetical protein
MENALSFKKDYLRAAIIYLVLIYAIYSPVVFYNRTLSTAARYPWYESSPSEAERVLPKVYPNIFNVDLAHPAAHEEPIDVFIGKYIRRGIFPLWNPFLACGTTIIEQFSTRSLFPYQLLQNVCPWQWRDFFLLGRLFFAAMGVFIFLRLLGVSFYPSLCGGIMYGFSGAMTIFLTLTEMSNIGMMLPYALMGVELLNHHPSIFSLSFSSIATALLILGGQPEVALYGILFICLYCVFRIITAKNSKISITSKTAFFFLSTILALLISSPSFLPFLINSKHLYTLHPPAGTMGIETPTPLANFMAIFFPELLRWKTMASSFTINFGWDSLGGYVGITCIFLIIASFTINWWGRKEYLFFLFFAIFILLKNMGIPIVSWIGRLPLFDQVWTPRWAGPVWNLSLILSSALGFQALILAGNRKSGINGDIDTLRNKACVWWMLAAGILILSFGALINPVLWILIRETAGMTRQISFNTILALRLFLILISAIMLSGSVRRLKLTPLFLILSFFTALSVFSFNAQLPHIDGPFKSILQIKDKSVLFSMWQAMVESTIFSLIMLLGLSLTLKQKSVDKIKFTFIISGIILIEMSFHTTIGYNEIGRLIFFLWHIAALLCLILYSVSLKKDMGSNKIKVGLYVFFIGMILIGAMGLRCIPKRRDVFKSPYKDLNYDGYSRIMGIRGLIFPNMSAALEIQDIKSIVSISIKRFQLFQDLCLSVSPQFKYKSLWFTGIMDTGTGKNISEHIRERHPFYSLAGITNYISPYYEDIPYTKLIRDGSVKIYQNLRAMPRAFIVHKWFLVNTPELSLAWMLSNYSSFDSGAVVEGKDIPSAPYLQDKPFTKVKIRSYSLHSVVIDAQTDALGLLVLTDTYYPDWIVTVNGKKEKIFPADLCFRGVFLNPGKHEVRFIYFPKTFYICSAISLITLLVLFILTLKSLRIFFHA